MSWRCSGCEPALSAALVSRAVRPRRWACRWLRVAMSSNCVTTPASSSPVASARSRRIWSSGTPPSGWALRGAYPRGLGADDRRLLPDLAASGQTAPTIRLRRLSLAHIARGPGRPPAGVTGEQLVAWFGRQTHWRPATRRNYRGAARGFFAWAYRPTASPTVSATICPPCVTARRCHGRSPTPCGVTRWPQSI